MIMAFLSFTLNVILTVRNFIMRRVMKCDEELFIFVQEFWYSNGLEIPRKEPFQVT